MIEVLKKYSYALYVFLFVFCLYFLPELPVVFSQFIIVTYIILIFPLSEYFSDAFSQLSLKSVWNKKILLVCILSVVGYFLSFDVPTTLLFLFCIISFLFSFHTIFFFTLGIGLFSISLLLLFFGNIAWYPTTFLFSFISLIIGITLFLFSSLSYAKYFHFTKTQRIGNTLFVLFHMIIIASIFYAPLMNHLLSLLSIFLLIYNLFSQEKDIPKDLIPIARSDIFKSHLIIFSSFILIFIPILDIHLIGEQNKNLFFILLVVFTFYYIFATFLINKIKK